MVEIAKALSFDSARPDHGRADRGAERRRDRRAVRASSASCKAEGVGIVYISHKMDELQADRRPRHRDARRRTTSAPCRRPSTPHRDASSRMMVGPRACRDERAAVPGPRRHEVVLEVRGLRAAGARIRDVSFALRKGEILGFAGLMGAGRTEVARAVFGADPIDAGEILRARPRGAHPLARAMRSRHGIGYLSEDRKHFGLATGMDVETNIVLASLSRFLSLGCFLDEARASRDIAAGLRRAAAHQDASDRAAGAPAVGRQPAEDRDRQMAAARLRHPVLRRADARHRRRREERDLQAAERAGRAGQGDRDDLVRAARGAAHEPPHRW